MSETKHTPEPWEKGTEGESYTEIVFAYPDSDIKQKICTVYGDNHKEDARRVLACVNGSQGLPTEHLEGIHRENADYWGKVATDRDKYKAQRDELLAALKFLADATESATTVFETKVSSLKAYRDARKLIDSVKSQE